MKPARVFALVLLLTALAAPAAPAQTAAARLAEAQAFEASGQIAKAKDAYRAVWRGQPKSPEAPAALFAHARLEEASNDYLAAYRNLERLVDKYPKSQDFNRALEGMFRIATKFLEGEKLKLLGVPAVPSMSKAAEMFDKIVSVGPYSRIAPAAQFNAGLAYEKARRYPEAIAAYQRVSDNYPGSEFASDALYQAAYVLMLQTKAAAYDQTATKKALNAFQEFVITYPNHPKTPQALKNIAELESRRTAGALSVAEFYEAYGNTSAAIVSYQRVIDQNPGTEDARRAAGRIAALRAKMDAQASGGEKDGFRNSSLAPKLPKIRVPFFSKKEGEEEKSAESAAPPAPAGAPKKPAPKPSARKPSRSAAEETAPALDFADPGPQIRAEPENAVSPVPAPEAPATPDAAAPQP